MKRSVRYPLAVLVLLVATLGVTYWWSSSPLAETTLGTFAVERVIDGDSFVITYEATSTQVRLIGLNAPEYNECFGPSATREARRLLTGQTIRLELDPTQDERDTYDRILAYAYLPDGTLFNQYMIRQGFAREYTHIYPYQHQAEFQSAQAEAQEARRGLWAPGACE